MLQDMTKTKQYLVSMEKDNQKNVDYINRKYIACNRLTY